MLEIRLGNGVTIGPVSVLREMIQVETGTPEVDVDFVDVQDIKVLYDTINNKEALGNMTIVDLEGVEPDTILTGYNTIKGLERTLDTIGTPGFRVVLRITKE